MEQQILAAHRNPKAETVSALLLRSSWGVARLVGMVLLTLGVFGVTFLGTTIIESIFFSDWLSSL
jgi:hypothetical protein